MPRHRSSRSVGFLLVACACAVFAVEAHRADALAPDWAISQFAHDAWLARDGLPQGAVEAVAQTADGYLWLGTDGGLVRFDGVRFTVYGPENVEAFENEEVWALEVDPQQRLWIGTNGGGLVLRDVDGSFRHVGVEEGLPAGRVTSLVMSADGESLWIGTYGGGVARLRDGRFDVWSTPEGLLGSVVLAVFEDSRGDIWVGTQPGGLNRLRGGEVTASYTSRDGLASDMVYSIVEDASGDVWVATIAGLSRLRGAVAADPSRPVEIENFTREDGLTSDSISRLWVDRDDTLWIGTHSDGLNRLQAGRFDRMTEHDGLSADGVTSLFEDHLGHLWIGTSSGLDRLKEGMFRPFGRQEGLSSNETLDVFEDHLGRIWIGTWGGGVNRVEKDGSITVRTTRDGLPADFVCCVTEEADGTIWLGTSHGLYRWAEDPADAMLLRRADGLASDAIFELYLARDESLWIGTNEGLTHLDHGRMTTLTTVDGLAGDQIRSFAEDDEGRLWVGTSTGVGVRDEGGWRTDILRGGGRIENYVFDLHFGSDGALWMATTDRGILRLENGELSVVSHRVGLLADSLCYLTEDGVGNLWVTSKQGIQRLDWEEVRRYVAGETRSVHSVLYGPPDGVRGGRCSRNHGARIGEDLWFVTNGGVAVLDLERVDQERPARTVRIEMARLDDVPRIAPRHLEVPADARSLELRYTVLGGAEPRRARFRYRLVPFDSDWVDAGSRREAYYTHLPPGDYRFEVTAEQGDESRLENVATLDISVLPAFHQTVWFYLLCGGLLGLTIWGGYRYRVGGLERYASDLERMRAEVEAKNEELETKNAELERFTYTVSHDLKSPLVTIQGFLGHLRRDFERGEKDRFARDYSRIDGAARKMARQLDELLELSRIGRVVYSIEEVDLAELIEETLERLDGPIRRVAAEIVTAPSLPRVVGDRRRLVEVMQNLLENALRYRRPDVVPRIEIDAATHGDEVLCSVRDNGLGIDPRYLERVFELFEQLRPDGEGTGIGLSLVRRIVESHDGRIWAESDGEGCGSTFFFTLPKGSLAVDAKS